MPRSEGSLESAMKYFGRQARMLRTLTGVDVSRALKKSFREITRADSSS